MKALPSVLAALALASTLAPLLAAEVPTFRAVDVDTKIEIGYGVTVADVDGDKKPDILLADKNLIVWYQNPSWQKHIIAEKLTALDHVCLAAQDIDGDGKCEIAVGAGWNPGDTVNSGALFYLVPSADRTQRWKPIPLPHEPTVHRIRWVETAPGKFDLISVPLHGRGNKASTGDGDGVKILALEKPAISDAPWKTRLLDQSLHKTHNFDRADPCFGPGAALFVAGKEGVYVLHNLDRPLQPRYCIIPPVIGGAGEVRLGRLGTNQFFTATIEPMHGNTLCAYTHPPKTEPPPRPDAPWIRHVLDETLVDGHALACGDLSGTGRDSIVVGWRAMGRPGVKVGIKLFTAIDADGKQWKSTLVDDNTMACEDLCLADLDGDGRLDIIAAGRATKNVKVYFNQGVK